MVHTTPSKALLAPTLQPLVGQLSGSLAHGARLIDHFLHQEPTPQKMATFEQALRTLLREVGRRLMAWVLNHLEPQRPEEMPSRVAFQGQLSRRRRKHRPSIATLFGTVEVWRRLYAPLVAGAPSLHPLALRWGLEAGLATPALAGRLGRWAADHSQRQVLEMLRQDHGVPWSCPTLRKLLWSLSRGMGAQRHAAQVDRVVGWLRQARASQGRFQPTLAVGRDGVNVPLRHGDWQEGSTATVSVVNRCGKRVGTVSLGQMPEAGQPTLTAQLTKLLQDILRQVDAQSLRLVSVSDDGYHPSDYYHHTLKPMTDPKRPWRKLEWRRIVDSSHACLYVKQLAEALYGPGPKGQAWAKERRQQLKTPSAGSTRVLQSASALRLK